MAEDKVAKSVLRADLDIVEKKIVDLKTAKEQTVAQIQQLQARIGQLDFAIVEAGGEKKNLLKLLGPGKSEVPDA